MSVEVYQYPACGTCKKALKWLKDHGVAFTSRHIVESPPPRAELALLVKRSGTPIRKWLNTSGQSYRQGGFREKLPAMSDAQILDALAADGKLISAGSKRRAPPKEAAPQARIAPQARFARSAARRAKLNKRPIVIAGDVVLVGFSEAEYAEHFG